MCWDLEDLQLLGYIFKSSKISHYTGNVVKTLSLAELESLD